MSLGKILDRAEMYGTSSTGEAIQQTTVDQPCAGCGSSIWACEAGTAPGSSPDNTRCCGECFHREPMKARPTTAYAPRPSSVRAGEASEVEIDLDWARAWQALPQRQREAWRIYNRPRKEERTSEVIEKTIEHQELQQYERMGWELVEGLGDKGWIVRKMVTSTPTYEDVGRILDVSASEARRLERTAAKALAKRGEQ